MVPRMLGQLTVGPWDVLGDARRGAVAAGEARNGGGGGQSEDAELDDEPEVVDDDVVLLSLPDELDPSELLSDDESVPPVPAPLSLEAPELERLSVL